MKTLLVAASILLISSNAFARGVLLSCWEEGAEQSTDHLIYETDGEYIHSTTFRIGQESLVRSSEECIDWDFPSVCQEKLETTSGKDYTLLLSSLNDYTSEKDYETLIGYIHRKGERAIALSCKREAL